MVFGKSSLPPPPPRPNVEIPETKANLFSKLTFWWLNDLMKLGYKRPLEKDDLYVLNDARTAKIVTEKFSSEWKKEIEKIALGKKPSLIKALYRVFWARFCLAGVVRFGNDILAVISPLILRLILKFISDAYFANFNNDVQPPAHIGYLLIVVMFLMEMGASMLFSTYFYYALELGFLSRTILITTIYQKALVLMGLLIFNIGPSALVGFVLLVILGPLQGKVMSLLARTRAKASGVTDERIKLMQEILLGIRVIKYYAWEDSFADALNKLRNREIGLINFLLAIRAAVSGVSMVFPIFAGILSFITFSLTGGSLDVEIVFSSLALFNLLRTPLTFLPKSIASVTDAYVAINRINDFLLADELSFLPKIIPGEQYAIKVTDGEFIWESAPPEEVTDNSKNERRNEERVENNKSSDDNENNTSLAVVNEKDPDASTALILADFAENFDNSQSLSQRSQLFNINISVPHGKLIAIVGSVRSGKSSLLSALIGDMKRIKGEVLFGGNVVYCPQTAWIQNATLRDNITFGLPFYEEKYQQVIKDCCLDLDLEILPAGDLTKIGEKGINLSGGQKQRISIARAVYYDADIVLLDDPLSAVDTHVGSYLFTNCIQGALAKKTRLLVTHHLHYLPQVDYVIYMEDGKIVEQGTYEALMKDEKTFSKLIAEYGEAKYDDEIKNDDESTLNEKKNKDQIFDLSKEFMSTEERCKGTVNNEIYLAYLRNAGGLLSILIIVFLLVIMQGANIGNNLWLSFWSSNMFDFSIEFYIGVYCALGVIQGIFSTLCSVAISFISVKAAKRLHNNAIKRVLRAPISFFDTTPLGRIINRFSQDVDTCDSLLSELYQLCFITVSNVIGTFILIIVVFASFIIPLIPLTILNYLVALVYRASNNELKRLVLVLRSSSYAHFSETLTGLPIIRAYRKQEQFLRNNEAFLDIENRAYFLSICTRIWLLVRLYIIASVLVFFASLFAIIFRFNVAPSITGLVLSYALQVCETLNWCIEQVVEVDANMNSVEHLVYYSDNLEIEAENIIPENRPPSGWPAHGDIQIKNLEIKYWPDSPLVLKGITVKIMAAEKIGIVGRTGCGKSTLAMSFFRLIEATSGSIVIDSIDISTIGLKDLRSNITLIPQDPVLFDGTVRSNLDPFNEHSDLVLWNALRRVHLIKNHSPISEKNESNNSFFISNQKNNKQEPIMLDSPVKEHGSNFSQGQRQLIAIARALVHQTKLIIMDEATASIDFKTDHLIQATIREEFKDNTVITIAHRLRTVADYDKILVMESGNIVEFDIPYLLLQKPGGLFREMCEKSGEFAELKKIAKRKYENISPIH
ncbi:P-loop containing nucleoside triphosphate hydrolase protein [Gigaspora rosea]|uniref:P-loop containing nucleoside triphosphate hydrolase protein n=1 Tax=Gigaspora rosea TaxID=44941 RepID=A0A397U757_9GLOM|nr:P-loop containing nucleoside triphosphate hydrolase protein [Gigaspora rosea]